MDTDEITHAIIGAGVTVHEALGPGLLETVYERCLALELRTRGLDVARQHAAPVHYRGLHVRCGFRVDLFVEGLVPVEVKAAAALTSVHLAQMLTYLRLLDCRVGLLLNFNQPRLLDGVKRVVNGYESGDVSLPGPCRIASAPAASPQSPFQADTKR